MKAKKKIKEKLTEDEKRKICNNCTKNCQPKDCIRNAK